MNSSRSVILFGGQGSSTLFSQQAASAAIADARVSSQTAILLSRCHAAFLEALDSLGSAREEVIADGTDFFVSSEKILAPGESYRDNALIQGTTICLHQLLRYLSFIERSSREFESVSRSILETAGFCSGLLPAIVVASSRTVQEYVDYSVEAFRLAFWIGYRSTLYCQKMLGSRWKDFPWSLVLTGMSRGQVAEQLDAFHTQVQRRSLSIAAINGERCISVSGPGADLVAFKEYCSTSSSANFGHVHAYYHGGTELRSIIEDISGDVKARSISFPSFGDLQRPVRSTLDGSHLTPENAAGDQLVDALLSLILVHPVDWLRTSGLLTDSLTNHLDNDPDTTVQVLSFGPHSNLLLSDIKRRLAGYTKVRTVDLSPSTKSLEPPNSKTKDGIAIVGMGINFPRGKGVDQLWDTLKSGLSALEEIPGSRFDLSQFHSDDPSQTKGRKMGTRHGNFIDGAWSFDPSFFNISPREAKSMDPQQRVLLHTALAAMEDAGYVEDATPSFQKNSFGCYIGAATGDYTDNLKNDIDVYYSPGTLRAFLSGKISYAFKLSGPSVVIDTACSSSLVAIHQACRALQNGDCTAAIAGGVNVICSPDMYLGLSRAHFLSPTGQCKPFDEDADGYSRAEGCGLFILKHLADAVAEKDHIYGVIRGVELNQCGNAQSITHPHAKTQAALFERLLEKTKVDPLSVSVIEAHGTGTQAGDFAEITSLQSVFGHSRSTEVPLVISSIKGNIGHCEAASGSAGLAKLLLMLRQETIPVQASLSRLNPRVAKLLTEGIIIPRQTLAWHGRSSQPRKALLNNFGAAGSNAALLLEEYVESRDQGQPEENRTAYPFNISARSVEALSETVHAYQHYLRSQAHQAQICDICYTATTRRQVYHYRLSVTCSSTKDLAEKLATATFDGIQAAKDSRPVIFIFSGQGSSYPGMGKEMMETSTLFQDIVLSCDGSLKDLGFPSILRLLQDKEDGDLFLTKQDQVVGSQCACVIFEYALAKLWISWGIVPDIVLGHSLGEYAALAISGALSLSDALRLVAFRARLMMTDCLENTSGMLACRLSSAQAEQILTESDLFSELSVACRNGQTDCVIAGPLKQLEDLASYCTQAGYKTKKLSVPYGFHSAFMDPIVEPLKSLGKSINILKPVISIGSGVFGRVMTLQDLDSDYFARHAREPVRFLDLLQDLERNRTTEGAQFIEIGPHPTTLPMVSSTLSGKFNNYLPSIRKDRTAWHTLCESLGHLFISRDNIQWREVFRGTPVRLVNIPGHPLATTEYCVRFREPSVPPNPITLPEPEQKTRYALLAKLLPSQSTQTYHLFETNMSILGEYILGHAVGGVAICPASVFHEMVLEAAQTAQELPNDTVYVVRDMVFASPLLYQSAHDPAAIHVSLTKIPSLSDMEFSIVSCKPDDTHNILHCSGSVSCTKVSSTRTLWASKAALVKRQEGYLLASSGSSLNTFQTSMIYQTIFPRVVAYSQDYHTLKSLSVSVTTGEGHGSFQVAARSHATNTVTSHVFTDTLLHAAGFIANITVPATEICMCGRVGNIQLLYNDIDWSGTFTVYCSLFDDTNGTIIADASALDSNGKMVAVIEGMHFKKLRLSAFKAHLGRTVQSMTADAHLPLGAGDSGSDSTGSEDTLAASDGSTPVGCSTPISESVKNIVSQVISELCDIPEKVIDTSQDLSALGIDYSMLQELYLALKRQFPNRTVNQSGLIHCRTLQDLEDAIVSAYSNPSITLEQPKKAPHTMVNGDVTHEQPSKGSSRAKSRGDRVRRVLRTVCEVDDSQLSPNRSLDSLGIDSLMSIELEHALQQELGFKVSLEKLRNGTIRDLEELENPKSSRSTKGNKSTGAETEVVATYRHMLKMESLPVTLQTSDTPNMPLYLFHDGSGLCNMYSRLHGLDRDVFGFFNPAFFDAEKGPKTLVEMAAHYASATRTSSPIILGGWSFGGIVALEVARQLRAAKHAVAGIILIDSPYPINHTPLPNTIITHIAGKLSPSSSSSSDRKQHPSNDIRQHVLAQFRTNAALLSKYHPEAPPSSTPIIMLRSRAVFPADALVPDSKINYPWLTDQAARDQAIAQWRSFVGPEYFDVLDIPGHHFEALSAESIGETSRQVKKACEIFVGKSGNEPEGRRGGGGGHS